MKLYKKIALYDPFYNHIYRTEEVSLTPYDLDEEGYTQECVEYSEGFNGEYDDKFIIDFINNRIL